MITAVDTSVLIAIAKAEFDVKKWTNRLVDAQNDGDLVICDEHLIPDFLVRRRLRPTRSWR